jgi:hypothetical protein
MRIVLTVIACAYAAYVAFVVLTALDLPTAVVCERGRTYVEATPHRVNKSFEERRIGPCVFYNPKSVRAAGGGGYVGD